jgi:hypothetical protein
MKIAAVAHIFVLLYSAVKFSDKKGFGYFLGEIFINSSGHPAPGLRHLQDSS